MTKERLSKLQRWILNKCYEYENKEMWRYQILRFFSLKGDNYYINGRNKAEASITRSLKNLFKKGYIDLALGNIGGSYSLEDEKKSLKSNIQTLKKIKKQSKPEISELTGKQYDAKYMEDLIAYREEIIEKRILYNSVMGHNIHRLKLLDKGIELVEMLKVKKKAISKT